MYIMRFIIDEDADMACVYGEYSEHDDQVTINLAKMDSLLTVIITILHEELHQEIARTGTVTTEKQDHYIIPRMLS